MSYADPLRTVGGLTGDAIGDLIEGALGAISADSGTSLINTTSTSDTAYTGASIAVTVASGEQVVVFGMIAASNSNSTNKVSATLYEDASAIGLSSTWVAARNDTAGFDATIPMFAISSPSVGAHTYTIKWKTSANTAYSGQFYFIVVKIRTS